MDSGLLLERCWPTKTGAMRAAKVAVKPFGCTAAEDAPGRRLVILEVDRLMSVLLLDPGWPTADAAVDAAVDTGINIVAIYEVLTRSRRGSIV